MNREGLLENALREIVRRAKEGASTSLKLQRIAEAALVEAVPATNYAGHTPGCMIHTGYVVCNCGTGARPAQISSWDCVCGAKATGSLCGECNTPRYP